MKHRCQVSKTEFSHLNRTDLLFLTHWVLFYPLIYRVLWLLILVTLLMSKPTAIRKWSKGNHSWNTTILLEMTCTLVLDCPASSWFDLHVCWMREKLWHKCRRSQHLRESSWTEQPQEWESEENTTCMSSWQVDRLRWDIWSHNKKGIISEFLKNLSG